MSFTIYLIISLLEEPLWPKIYWRLNRRVRQIRQIRPSGENFRGSNRRERILCGLSTTVLHAFSVRKVSVVKIGEGSKSSSFLINFPVLTFFEGTPEHYIKLYSNLSLHGFFQMIFLSLKRNIFLIVCVSIDYISLLMKPNLKWKQLRSIFMIP